MIVTDDFPAFFLPRMVASAARQVSILMEKVDSNGRLADTLDREGLLDCFLVQTFPAKQHRAPSTLISKPDPLAEGVRPFNAQIPGQILERWPPAHDILESLHEGSLASFPIDHSVPPSPIRGGERAASRTLEEFLKEGLDRYADCRNHPDDDATSGLSAYLHFGHISVHQVFQELMDHEGWSKNRIWPGGRGQREGWWGMSRNAESFLDQLITWRELGYNMCAHLPLYDRYESLPAWAQESLDRHRNDPRPYLYGLDRFENAETHDPLWNAAQMQLKREGRLHNYLRMLWGKKILEWTRSPEDALDIMIHLNNKYALDGRNPNSLHGNLLDLGTVRQTLGPERPVFGRIRYMSSENTRRKLRVKQYLRKYSE